MLKEFNQKYYIKFIVLICIVVMFNILILPRISNATNNTITSLKVDDRTYLNPNQDITLSAVDSSTESITIKPTTSDGATYTINGGNSTTVPLKTGANIIKIAVTGGETYIVRITRLAEDSAIQSNIIDQTQENIQKNENNLLLSSLKIQNFELTPEFDSNIYWYTVNYNIQENSVNKLDIDAVPSLSNATVEIIGNENFVQGENIITILVKTADGTESVVYQIVVNINDLKTEIISTSVFDNIGFLSDLTPFQRNVLIGFAGAVLLLVIIVIIIFIRKAKKKKEQISFDEINSDEDVLAQEKTDEQNVYKEKIQEIIQSTDEEQQIEKSQVENEKTVKSTLDKDKAALMDEFFSYNQSINENYDNETRKEEKKNGRNRRKGKHF